MLAVVLQINRVADQLGGIARNGGEWTNTDAIGAVDVVMFGDGGMAPWLETGYAIRVVGIVGRAGAGGKTDDSVTAAD